MRTLPRLPSSPLSRVGLLITALTASLLSVGCGGEEPADPVPVVEVPDASDGSDLAPSDASRDDTQTPGTGVVDDVDATEPSDALDEDTGEEADAQEEAPDVPAPADPCDALETGAPCDDGEPCTKADVCKPDGCGGTAYECNDGFGCTRDLCDGSGACTFPLFGDRCFIDGACWDDGDVAPGGCLACVSPVSQTTWTADDTQGCDDADACTSVDVCFGGECVGLDANECNDDNLCTDDFCTTLGGCGHSSNTRFCDDGDECTVGDLCKNSVCLPGSTYVTCDDGNPCTKDGCFTGLGCMHENDDGICNDGDVCTIDDACTKGVCVSGPVLDCADSSPCTDDLCHPVIGCITRFNALPCNDGNYCTQGDVCAYGNCQKGNIATACTDGNPCTIDSCDIGTGACKFTAANGTPCSDGNACTLGDFCEAKKCKSGGQVVSCDDDNPCTDDKCNAGGQCEFIANFLDCDDGDPCTVGDECAAGFCEPGKGELSCTDKNPCTDTFCTPNLGCKTTTNTAPCNDNNACTTGDQCLAGQCIPGSVGATCDDLNGCTDDSCIANKGCVNVPNFNLCSDGEACTVGDQCQDGQCVGFSSQCDDNNECTKEICLAGGGCQHIPINSFECRPQIFIIYPPRGAMIYGPSDVFVTGYVTSGGQGLAEFFINGFPVVTHPTSGAFTFQMKPEVGMNSIQAIATSKLGGQDKAVRAFAWSTKFIPPGQTLPSGLGIWLSQQVWDDNNTSDIDDIATVFTLLLESFDLAALVPNPLTSTSALQCKFTVYAQPVFIGNPSVDIKPINQALQVTVSYPNLYVGLDVDASGFLCPGLSGNVTADKVQVTIDLVAGYAPNGSLTFDLANPKVDIQGLDVEIDGILGFLFNWIIDLFEGTISDQIEATVLGQFANIPLDLASALQALAITQQFELPSLIGDAPPAVLELTTSLSAADFDQFGGFFELGSSMKAIGGQTVPYLTLGSLGRDKCGKLGEPDFFDYLMQNELEIAFKDDLINQMLHAAWYAGAFEIPLPKSLLGDVDTSQYGVEILDLSLSFLLPPILSSCNYDDKLKLGIGDMRVKASLNLFGQPLELEAYASAVIEAQIEVIESVDGNTIGITLSEIGLFEVEVEDVNAGFEGAQGAVEDLIGSFLGPNIFDSLGASALSGIPLPEIPLDGFSDAIPKGTTLKLELTKAYRLGGRTVMAGNVKQ